MDLNSICIKKIGERDRKEKKENEAYRDVSGGPEHWSNGPLRGLLAGHCAVTWGGIIRKSRLEGVNRQNLKFINLNTLKVGVSIRIKFKSERWFLLLGVAQRMQMTYESKLKSILARKR
jgi:hypothetical protein